MFRKDIILKTIIVLLISNYSFSQGQAKEFFLHLKPGPEETWWQEVDISSVRTTDFIAVSIVIEGPNINANTINGKMQTTKKRHEIPTFGEDPLQENRFVSELIYLTPQEAGIMQLSFEARSGIDFSGATGKIRIFVPQKIESTTSPQIVKASPRYFACPCPQPDYVPRVSWGSGFRLTSGIFIPPATYTTVTHLIVHHSAGTNTSSNWAGVVAAIFDFHVNTNGWQDVGYNWLIDPNGVIYEGRGGGDNVRGAHMCGYNNNSTGVCLLGNFVTAEPSINMINALKRLLAWKACKENISPSGGSNIISYPGIMQHISGHRDGCAPNYTECPGTNLYAKLSTIRSATGQYIIEACGSISESQDLKIKSSISIFPNPVADFLKFESVNINNKVEIDIIDLTGRLIMEVKNLDTKASLDISNISDGLYILRAESDGKVFIQRFVKH